MMSFHQSDPNLPHAMLRKGRSTHWNPLTLIISFVRPVIQRLPFLSNTPSSPVLYHPSGVSAWLVSSMSSAELPCGSEERPE